MICKQCGNEISDTSKFCPECGTPLQTEAPEKTGPVEEAFAEAAPAEEQPQPKKKNVLACIFQNPNLLVGLLLAAISFVAGVILLSLTLARAATGNGIDLLVILPAFASLILNIYTFFKANKEENKNEKILLLVGIFVAAFVLLFAFIACCII